ncbi:MAG: hypothetical protein ACRC1L_07145, partial [Prochlorococcaceae cyanobacterium]
LSTTAWLEPISGLWREEPAHRYWLGEHLFPVSITAVLAHGLDAMARKAIAASRPIWEPRGTAVHAALERYSQVRFRCGDSPERALLAAEELPGHHRYRDWILPLLQLPHWEEVEVIASERLTCCLARNVAGAFDGAYSSPALSERRGHEVRVLYDLKTLSARGRPYSTAAQLGGYMALEAAQGNHYQLGQTIWSKPGEASLSAFYSREQCLAAWAAAWSDYALTQRPF